MSLYDILFFHFAYSELQLVIPLLPETAYERLLETFVNGQALPVSGVGLDIFLGLVLGKPVGITLFSFLAIKSRICAMPDKAKWGMFFAVACLGGIGFTMSIFVDTLSFSGLEQVEQMRNAGKIAILMGSLAAGVLGSVLITFASKGNHSAEN